MVVDVKRVSLVQACPGNASSSTYANRYVSLCEVLRYARSIVRYGGLCSCTEKTRIVDSIIARRKLSMLHYVRSRQPSWSNPLSLSSYMNSPLHETSSMRQLFCVKVLESKGAETMQFVPSFLSHWWQRFWLPAGRRNSIRRGRDMVYKWQGFWTAWVGRTSHIAYAPCGQGQYSQWLKIPFWPEAVTDASPWIRDNPLFSHHVFRKTGFISSLLPDLRPWPLDEDRYLFRYHSHMPLLPRIYHRPYCSLHS